jgi:hypothetical protein
VTRSRLERFPVAENDVDYVRRPRVTQRCPRGLCAHASARHEHADDASLTRPRTIFSRTNGINFSHDRYAISVRASTRAWRDGDPPPCFNGSTGVELVPKKRILFIHISDTALIPRSAYILLFYPVLFFSNRTIALPSIFLTDRTKKQTTFNMKIIVCVFRDFVFVESPRLGGPRDVETLIANTNLKFLTMLDSYRWHINICRISLKLA